MRPIEWAIYASQKELDLCPNLYRGRVFSEKIIKQVRKSTISANAVPP